LAARGTGEGDRPRAQKVFDNANLGFAQLHVRFSRC
jgi:hypothetical protein